MNRNLVLGKNRFEHESIGWNFRMSNLQAAVGVAQLERITDTLSKRKESVGQMYEYFLKETIILNYLWKEHLIAKNIYWVFGIVSLQKKTTLLNGANKLKEEYIGRRPFFYPMHLQKKYKRNTKG